MSVLQVVSDTDRRGAQVSAVDLGAVLVRQGRTVTTVALAPGRQGGLDLPVLGDTAMSVPTLRALRAAMRDADVVLAHGSTTLPACAIAGIATATPFVYRQISDSRFWANTTARRVRVRAGLARAARVVALWHGSATVLQERFGVARDKVRVIPNGIPPDRFPAGGDPVAERRALALPGLVPDRFTAVFVGALVTEKGVDVAIRAVRELPDVQLLIVGDGADRAAFESLAAPDAARITFVGAVDDVGGYYRAADVVLLPSVTESMPATLIEGALSGRPAVATAVGAIPEIVLDGRTGYLVPVGDVDAVRDAIGRLASAPDTARAFGGAAREHCVDAYAIDVVADRWGAVIDQLGRHTRRR